MAESKSKNKEKGLPTKVIIIGKPRTDLAKKLARGEDVEVLSPNTTITQVLKKYGSDHNLHIYSHGYVYNVKIDSWMPEPWVEDISKVIKRQGGYQHVR